MRSLKTKLLAVLVPIMSIAFVLVAWMNYHKAKEMLESNFEQLSFITLENTQIELNKILNIHIERLNGFAQSSDMNNMLSQQSYINRIGKQFPEYSLLLVADKNGNTITSVNSKVNIADRDYFQRIMAGEDYAISDPIISKVDQSSTIVFAVPIKNSKDEIIGVFGGSYPIESLQKIISEVKVGKTGYAFITQRNGMFISHPNKEIVFQSVVEDLKIPQLTTAQKEARSGKSGMIRYKYNGEERFTFYKQLESKDWNLFITVPVMEATSQLSILAKLSFITAGIVLLITIIIISLFSSRLIKPIKK